MWARQLPVTPSTPHNIYMYMHLSRLWGIASVHLSSRIKWGCDICTEQTIFTYIHPGTLWLKLHRISFHEWLLMMTVVANGYVWTEYVPDDVVKHQLIRRQSLALAYKWHWWTDFHAGGQKFFTWQIIFYVCSPTNKWVWLPEKFRVALRTFLLQPQYLNLPLLFVLLIHSEYINICFHYTS